MANFDTTQFLSDAAVNFFRKISPYIDITHRQSHLGSAIEAHCKHCSKQVAFPVRLYQGALGTLELDGKLKDFCENHRHWTSAPISNSCKNIYFKSEKYEEDYDYPFSYPLMKIGKPAKYVQPVNTAPAITVPPIAVMPTGRKFKEI